MKKIAVAFGLFGFFSVASAQSNVTVYGVLDTGLIKESGSDVRMGDYMTSRIGFKGSEDLGNGLKATFELEQRFRLNSGELTGNYSWDEKIRTMLGQDERMVWTAQADVGLAGPWGAVRLGRVPDMSVDTFTLADPFDQDGIASSFSVKSLLHSHYLSNTVRYDSPVWQGFDFGVTYTLGSDRHGDSPIDVFVKSAGNDGFAFNPRYQNGPVMLLANFERARDSDNAYLWDVGGTFQWGRVKLFLGYERTQFKLDVATDMTGNQKEWLGGLHYRVGPHLFIASYDRGEIDAGRYNGHADKYALGYNYDFSKRTRLYGSVIYIDSSNDDVGAFYNTNGAARDSLSGVQIGLTHQF